MHGQTVIYPVLTDVSSVIYPYLTLYYQHPLVAHHAPRVYRVWFPSRNVKLRPRKLINYQANGCL